MKLIRTEEAVGHVLCHDMTQIIKDELPMAEAAVLSGPSHAEEVSRGLPTLCVAGSRKKNVAEYVQSTFISPVFRVYTSPDVLGIETGTLLPWQRESLMAWVTGTTRKQPSSPAVWRRSRDLASPWAENTRPIPDFPESAI